jgi:hypothetical protein
MKGRDFPFVIFHSSFVIAPETLDFRCGYVWQRQMTNGKLQTENPLPENLRVTGACGR